MPRDEMAVSLDRLEDDQLPHTYASSELAAAAAGASAEGVAGDAEGGVDLNSGPEVDRAAKSLMVPGTCILKKTRRGGRTAPHPL